MHTSGQYEQRKKIRERLATRSLRFRDCLNRFDSRVDNCLEDTQFTITGEFDRTSRDHLIDTIHRLGGVVVDRLRTHSELFRVLTYKRTPRSQKLFDLHVAFLEPIEE